MNKMGTSGGYIKPIGSLEWAPAFFFATVITTLVLTSAISHAEVNRLGASLTVQQDQNDNYLMSSTQTETLSGTYLKPAIRYSHDVGFEKFSVDAQGSIERFNRSEYNVINPTYAVNYKRAMERATLSFGFDAARQSTRISEFTDSGNIVNGTTNQQIKTATAAWQYQITNRNVISMGGSMQTINYESAAYSDLKNNGVQVSWQSDLSDRLNFYTAWEGSRYEFTLGSNFYVAPKRILGYLLCPPNTQLVSETICISAIVPSGRAVNISTSSGLQTGIKWDIQEQLTFSLSAGLTSVETVQTIHIEELSVEYGSPIDQVVIFGGERSVQSESTLRTVNMNLNYQLEASTYTLSFSSKIQPSSSGYLLRVDSLNFSMKKSISEINWIEVNLSFAKLLTIGDKVAASALIDRDIFQSAIKYGHNFSNALVVTASVGYKHDQANENETIAASALLGVLALSYTPREWAW